MVRLDGMYVLRIYVQCAGMVVHYSYILPATARGTQHLELQSVVDHLPGKRSNNEAKIPHCLAGYSKTGNACTGLVRLRVTEPSAA